MLIRKITPEEAEARRLRALADAAEAQARIDRANADAAAERARAHAAETHAHAEAEKANAVAEKRRLRAELELAPLRDAHAKLQAERAQEDRAQAEDRRAHQHELMRRARAALTGRTFVTLAFAGVNGVAIWGQGKAYGDTWDAWFKAGVLECIALAVGWIGHQALINGRPARGKRIASYVIGLYMAVVNYSAFAEGWMPTAQAAGVALCSLVSPWLWGMYSRHVHADKLDDAGVVPQRAPDFPPLRWAFWYRQTLAEYRWGVRVGESDWRKCVAGWAHEQEEMRTAAQAEAERVRLAAESEQDRVRMTAERVRTVEERQCTGALLDDVRADLMRAYGHLATADVIANALLGPPTPARSLGPANGEQPSGRHHAPDPHDHPRDPHDPHPKDPRGGESDPPNEDDGDDDKLPALPGLPAPEELEHLDDREKLVRARFTVWLARQQGIDLRGRGAELARAYVMSPRWGQKRVAEETTPLFALKGQVVKEGEDEREDEEEYDDEDYDGSERQEATQ
ncbi:hypothetical protein [Nonomuraea recticatena]|uniref:DUF2637 domain-containing protein n=1 Tax=Nonomuraea recticatena TaxID=46178 RepID=A0ABN3RPY9_9ACTN